MPLIFPTFILISSHYPKLNPPNYNFGDYYAEHIKEFYYQFIFFTIAYPFSFFFFPLSPSLSHALYFFKISLNPQTHWFLKFFFPGENQINSVLFPYNEKISYICKRVILMELFLAKQKYSGSLSSCREFRDMVKIENTISILPWDD